MRIKTRPSRPPAKPPRPKPRAHPTPLLRGTLGQDIAHDIGVDIVSGRHQPGDILGGEVETSERLRVSRTAYREAVRILVAKGLVTAVRKAGTRVRPRRDWHLLDPDVLRWLFEREPDEQLLADLFELRRMVEPEAAALAAARRSEADLKSMAQALEEMAHYGLALESGQQADYDFHAALLRGTGNAFFASLVASVGAAVIRTTVYKQAHAVSPRDSLADHQRIYAAVAAQNAAAARAAMTELVDLALRDTREALSGRRLRARAG